MGDHFDELTRLVHLDNEIGFGGDEPARGRLGM
jgi:hypothetical protein